MRHTCRPTADNRGWRTPYRTVNGAAIPGFALAVSIMERRDEWNYDAYLDYAVRYMQTIRAPGQQIKGTNAPTIFMQQMWDEYHKQFGLVWEIKPESASP